MCRVRTTTNGLAPSPVQNGAAENYVSHPRPSFWGPYPGQGFLLWNLRSKSSRPHWLGTSFHHRATPSLTHFLPLNSCCMRPRSLGADVGENFQYIQSSRIQKEKYLYFLNPGSFPNLSSSLFVLTFIRSGNEVSFIYQFTSFVLRLSEWVGVAKEWGEGKTRECK